MDSIPNRKPLTGKLSARNWPAQFGGRGSAKPALPTPINKSLQPTPGSGGSSAARFTSLDPAWLSLGGMGSNFHAPTLGIVRELSVGGMSKPELLAALHANHIQLNEAALVLFACDQFITSETVSNITTVELCVANFGYARGATMTQIQERVVEFGLALCPVELGPHFRLQFLDQPECYLGYPPSQHRAPPGSITILSRELAEDESVPKGFYLRRIDGTLWLRGYRSGGEHIWSPEDRLLLCLPQNAA